MDSVKHTAFLGDFELRHRRQVITFVSVLACGICIQNSALALGVDGLRGALSCVPYAEE